MKTVRRALSRLPLQVGRSAGAPAHKEGRRKAHASRWILGLLLALGMLGASLTSAHVAQASTIGGGGCNVHYGTQQYGPWHTSLCLWGPYADSHGNLYYRASASCWVDPVSQNRYLSYYYSVECSMLNGNSLSANGAWHTYLAGTTPPQPAALYTFPTYSVYHAVQTSIWVHDGSKIIVADTNQVVYQVPSNGAAWTVYTP